MCLRFLSLPQFEREEVELEELLVDSNVPILLPLTHKEGEISRDRRMELLQLNLLFFKEKSF